MSALFWRSGTLYPTGSVVRPNAGAAPPAAPVLANAGFEDGAVGWTTLTGALAIVSDAGNTLAGTFCARLNGPAANSSIQNATEFPVTPGQSVSARCMIRVDGADQLGGTVAVTWYDAADAVISTVEGNQVNVLAGGSYRQSSVTATAPANAAYFKVAGFAFALQAGAVRFDAFAVTYQPPTGLQNLSILYRAVQPTVGTSAATEPAWPPTVGVQVNDGTVTWEAFEANIVVWQAEPILQTGGTEPAWPVTPGAVVVDNGIVWRCIGRNVRDERCPNGKVVAIGASKVFAADDDIVRYSATGNPLDWSSADDAGFLPAGLQQNGANRIDVLNLYRSNLVAMNASTFQMWQIDPDPEQMALLDAMEGIGSVYQTAAQPVANDLFMLTALGVRTVGIAAGSTNLQAGDVGMPIDTLVQESIASMTNPDPRSCYYPAAGQYWLIAGEQAGPSTPTSSIFFQNDVWINRSSNLYSPVVTGKTAVAASAELRAFIGQEVEDFYSVNGVVPAVTLFDAANPGIPLSGTVNVFYIPGSSERELGVTPPEAESIIGASLTVTEAHAVEIDACGGPLAGVIETQINASLFTVTLPAAGQLEFSVSAGAPIIPIIGSYLIRVVGTITTSSGDQAVDFLADCYYNTCF